MKILAIVEDDEDIRFLERTLLAVDPRIEIRGEGTSAEEALELARNDPADLIILDHQLGGEMTGLEAAPLLKKLCPQGKILLFTNQDVRREAEASPAIDVFLPKTEVGDFVETVQRMLDLPPG